jgi:hypothetical protein
MKLDRRSPRKYSSSSCMKEKGKRHSGRTAADASSVHAPHALLGLGVMLGWITFCLAVFPAHRSVEAPEIPPEQRNIVLRPDPLPELAVPHPPASPLEPIEGEDRYDSMIIRVAKRHQVDPALVKAVIRAESAYDHKAVSHRGAIGLMQLMPKTAQALGVEDSFNPELNIDGGVKYLRQLMDQFDGDVRLALAAYNAGSKKVRKYRGVPPFKQTRFYLQKVFRFYRSYKQQMAAESARV